MEEKDNNFELGDKQKKELLEDISNQKFFLTGEVEKGYRQVLSIRSRIDTLLLERGLKWAEVYNALGWNKSFASNVRNGKLIPPNWQRIALAKELDVDSSVIWQNNQEL